MSGDSNRDAANSDAGVKAENGLQPYEDWAGNAALSRFVADFKNQHQASLAVTLAEWKQSHNMIALRASQLSRALKMTRQGNILGAASTLTSLDPKDVRKRYPKEISRARKRQKDTSSAWLELHFGWSPLVGDIYDAIDVLQSEVPSRSFRGRGVSRQGDSGGTTVKVSHTYVVKRQCKAEVYVSNPNLALANQLGLINPAVVAWELVPWSFLVDWFIPVGSFLDSFSDFVGYEIRKPSQTTLRNAHERARSQVVGWNWDNYGFRFVRTQTLPSFKLRPTEWKGLSVTRGATAIALLIQQFLSVSPGGRTR